MPDSYKRWILIGIALIGVFLAVLVLYAPSFKKRDVVESSLQDPVPPPPQFTDSDLMQVLPVEDLVVDTSDPQSLARLGDEYFENSNYRQAIEIYKRATDMDPTYRVYLENTIEENEGENLNIVMNENISIDDGFDAEVNPEKNNPPKEDSGSIDLKGSIKGQVAKPDESSLPGIWIAIADLKIHPGGVEQLKTESQIEWKLKKDLRKGDIVLMWEMAPEEGVKYLFRAEGDAKPFNQESNSEFGWVKLEEKYTLATPLLWETIQNNSYLSDWEFVQHPQSARRQENIRSQGVWPTLRQALIDMDQSVEAVLDRWETPAPPPDDPSDAVPKHLDAPSDQDDLNRLPFAKALSRHLKRRFMTS